jgi:hypothetical protein
MGLVWVGLIQIFVRAQLGYGAVYKPSTDLVTDRVLGLYCASLDTFTTMRDT